LVSIVVPIYNAENYLKKCVDSLINQTYKDIEIILVNDGSTDDSLRICNEYNKLDKRVRVIDKENGGASSARNAGIKNANGEYIMFADSDDYVAENWVEELAASQNKNEDSFVICDIHWQDVDGTVYSQHNDIRYGKYALKEYYEVVENKLFNQPYNKIYKKSIIKENSISFNESFVIGEDINFNLDYIKHTQSVFLIDKRLYYYLENREDSLCHRYYEDLFEINLFTYKHNLRLFSLFSIEECVFEKLKLGFVGSVTDCLDRELARKQKSFSKRKKRMKVIMSNTDYLEALKQVKANINSKRFRVLNSKSPISYIVYYKMSLLK
jgi:glycosyltransferase involved in cell wall biosynthesis